MNIVLVGMGVIGGSIGLSIRGKVYGATIKGIDIDDYTLEKAKELGIIEEGIKAQSIEEKNILKEADVVILSLYPGYIEKFIDKNRIFFKSGSMIIDTSGVKKNLESIKVRDDVDFILTHPMAGREKKGIDFASRKVFIGANFIITKKESNKEKNIEFVKELASKMGFSNIVETTIDEHDKIIAFTSQLPHAIAVSLVNSDKLSNTGEFTGDSYKEITRIANINESLWAELFLANKDNLVSKIDDFEKELANLKRLIQEEDSEKLKELFIKATKKRKCL
ncbi:MAG: prephenate dehydrogenase [Sarcina sp.]